jgi:hypothetical protein
VRARVLFRARIRDEGVDIILRTRVRNAWFSLNDTIEIKPAVSDDYPTILRQVKLNGSQRLLVGEYTGAGATREQFVAIFATARVRVVFLTDLEGHD